MNLASVVKRFATGPYTVTRAGAGVYDVGGRHVPAEPTTFASKMVVQPVTGREVETLPEGLRTAEGLALWTTVELLAADAGAPDVVTVDGVDYEVQKVERWDHLGKYWKVLAVKV